MKRDFEFNYEDALNYLNTPGLFAFGVRVEIYYGNVKVYVNYSQHGVDAEANALALKKYVEDIKLAQALTVDMNIYVETDLAAILKFIENAYNTDFVALDVVRTGNAWTVSSFLNSPDTPFFTALTCTEKSHIINKLRKQVINEFNDVTTQSEPTVQDVLEVQEDTVIEIPVPQEQVQAQEKVVGFMKGLMEKLSSIDIMTPEEIAEKVKSLNESGRFDKWADSPLFEGIKDIAKVLDVLNSVTAEDELHNRVQTFNEKWLDMVAERTVLINEVTKFAEVKLAVDVTPAGTIKVVQYPKVAVFKLVPEYDGSSLTYYKTSDGVVYNKVEERVLGVDGYISTDEPLEFDSFTIVHNEGIMFCVESNTPVWVK